MLTTTFLFPYLHHCYCAAGKRVFTKSADHQDAYWSLGLLCQVVGVLIGAVAIFEQSKQAWRDAMPHRKMKEARLDSRPSRSEDVGQRQINRYRKSLLERSTPQISLQ